MPQRVATMVVPDDQGGYFIVVRVEDESRRTKAWQAARTPTAREACVVGLVSTLQAVGKSFPDHV